MMNKNTMYTFNRISFASHSLLHNKMFIGCWLVTFCEIVIPAASLTIRFWAFIRLLGLPMQIHAPVSLFNVL